MSQQPYEAADLFYEEDVKRLKVAFKCDDCDQPVYVSHAYIKMGDIRFCGEECLERYLLQNDVITVLDAE